MAYRIYCGNCKTETLHSTATGCIPCADRMKESAKTDFLAFRSKRTLEERLFLIESNLYDLLNKPAVSATY